MQQFVTLTSRSKGRDVRIPLEYTFLEGILTVPDKAHGIVLFAHGSGSSRLSPRNRYVAEVLNEHSYATLLADLLTGKEELLDQEEHHLRFNIPMLSARLERVTEWLRSNRETARLPVGYFGASTGAAAALVSAAALPDIVKAVVSRGGRPDLAKEALANVKAPTLLIVGGEDREVLALNKMALEKLNTQSALHIVPRATHLFEEPGTLEKAAHAAAEWFNVHLKQKR